MTHPPRLTGRPPVIAAAVERWALGALDDEAWQSEWILNGEDIGSDILWSIYDDVVERIQSEDYPVGYTELDALVFRRVDARAGTAQFFVAFDGEHPREDFSFRGHVEGEFSFTPKLRAKTEFLESVALTEADVRFDLDEPD